MGRRPGEFCHQGRTLRLLQKGSVTFRQLTGTPVMNTNNITDGRVTRAPASGAVEVGLIPSRVKPITLKLVFTASLLQRSALKGQCGEQAGKFTSCDVGKGTLRDYRMFGATDRWQATSKRAHQSVSRRFLVIRVGRVVRSVVFTTAMIAKVDGSTPTQAS